MKASKFSKAQIAFVLKQAEGERKMQLQAAGHLSVQRARHQLVQAHS